MDIAIVLKMVLQLFLSGNSSRKVKLTGELNGDKVEGVAILCKDGSVQINLYP